MLDQKQQHHQQETSAIDKEINQGGLNEDMQEIMLSKY